MDPTLAGQNPTPAGQPPAPASPPPPPPAPSGGQPAPSPAAAPANPAAGPGSSAVPGSGTNPTPATPAPFSAGASPATQATQPGAAAGQQPGVQPGQQPAAPASFDDQFRQRYGMTPDMAQVLMQMGYRQYQGQQAPGAAGPAQPAAPAQPAQPANPWGVPAFDRRLLDFVARDPSSGNLVVLPGGPPDAALRVQEYQARFQEAQRKLIEDPVAALGPIIQAEAQKVAAQIVQQQLGQVQTQGFAQQVIEQNKDWLFDKDAQGGVAYQFNPATGQQEPVLSAYGRFYNQLMMQYKEGGVANPQLRHQLAVQAIQNHLLQAKLQGQQAPAAGAAAAQTFLTNAAANPPAAPAPNPNPPAQPTPTAQTMRDVMRQRFNANGLTDDVVVAQVNRAA